MSRACATGRLEKRRTSADRIEHRRRRRHSSVAGRVRDAVLGRAHGRRFRQLHVLRERQPDARGAGGRPKAVDALVRSLRQTPVLFVLRVRAVFRRLQRSGLLRLSQPRRLRGHRGRRRAAARNPRRLFGQKNSGSLNATLGNPFLVFHTSSHISESTRFHVRTVVIHTPCRPVDDLSCLKIATIQVVVKTYVHTLATTCLLLRYSPRDIQIRAR